MLEKVKEILGLKKWHNKAHKFMAWKAKALNLPDLYSPMVQDYIDDKSELELRSWFERMRASEDSLTDNEICPFCQLEEDCPECPWGKEYGVCTQPDSWYQKIFESRRQAFSVALGQDNIRKHLV